MTLDDINMKLPARMDPILQSIQIVHGIVSDRFLGVAIDTHKRGKITLVDILERKADHCIVEWFETTDVEAAVRFIKKYMKTKDTRTKAWRESRL